MIEKENPLPHDYLELRQQRGRKRKRKGQGGGALINVDLAALRTAAMS